jgi:hypothetical protein
MIRTVVTAMIACVAVGAGAQDRPPADSVHPLEAGAGHRPQPGLCADGLVEILPGDYYFCEAVRSFSEGKPGKTVELLKDAAHWANKKAQYTLGTMYFYGDNAPLNKPLGLAWLALAAERRTPDYEKGYAQAYLSATPAQRVQGGELWKRMRAEYGDATAGVRAKRKFDRAMSRIQDVDISARGCEPALDGCIWGGVYISGLTAGLEAPDVLHRALQARGDNYFQGLQGTVSVGPLTAVDGAGAPAAPDSH